MICALQILSCKAQIKIPALRIKIGKAQIQDTNAEVAQFARAGRPAAQNNAKTVID